MDVNHSNVIAITPTDSQESIVLEPVKKGHFSVRGSGLVTWFWNKRLLILKNACFTIHKLQSEAKVIETIFYEEILDLDRSEVKPYCFKISVAAKIVYVACSGEEEMWSWMDFIYKRSPMKGVSNPVNFNHQAHMSFDADTGMLTTMNKQWDLTSPTLSKGEYLTNPEILLEFVQMCTGFNHRSDKPSSHSVLLETSRRFYLPEIPNMAQFEDTEFRNGQ